MARYERACFLSFASLTPSSFNPAQDAAIVGAGSVGVIGAGVAAVSAKRRRRVHQAVQAGHLQTIHAGVAGGSLRRIRAEGGENEEVPPVRVRVDLTWLWRTGATPDKKESAAPHGLTRDRPHL
jgi:hypothetical protein